MAPLPVLLEAGTGRLLTLPAPASTVMAADPKVARVQPASPTSIFVMGVAPGRTTIMTTADDGTAIAEYAVTVRGGNQPSSRAAAGGAGRPREARAIWSELAEEWKEFDDARKVLLARSAQPFVE